MNISFSKNLSQNILQEDRPARWASLACATGFFLHIIFSGSLLNAIGFHYSSDAGKFYEKVHPGTYFILLSFFIFLLESDSPLSQLYKIYRQRTCYTALLTIYIILFFYTTARSGFSGLAFIIDTHITAAICAIVFSYTPRLLCYKISVIFVALATMNGCAGIMESLGKFRIFTFDPAWSVLHEEYFRATAFMGHPLNNAMFTSVAIFVSAAIPMNKFFKTIILAILLASLVAFGGRTGLVFSVLGVLVLGCVEAIKAIRSRRLSMLKTVLLAASALITPLLLIGTIILLVNSRIGERIAADFYWDQSADARRVALQIFNYMTDQEIIFGVSTERIIDIAYRMGLPIPLADIENPWLLMFMYLGIGGFSIWLTAFLCFIGRLVWKQPFALKLAVVAYFLIASTSNSFGRKDSILLIMVSAVTCAGRSYRHRIDAQTFPLPKISYFKFLPPERA